MNKPITVDEMFNLVRQLTPTEQAQLIVRLWFLPQPKSAANGLTSGSKPENALNELRDLGKQISQGWPSGVSSAEVLSEMRR